MASEIHRSKRDTKRAYQRPPTQSLEARYYQLAQNWHEVVRKLNMCHWDTDVLRAQGNTTMQQKIDRLQAELDDAMNKIKLMETNVDSLRNDLAQCQSIKS